jgi:hypothetical protein
MCAAQVSEGWMRLLCSSSPDSPERQLRWDCIAPVTLGNNHVALQYEKKKGGCDGFAAERALPAMIRPIK